MYYNVDAYLPKAMKRAREAAKKGLSLRPEKTEAEKAADDARFSYKAGGGGLQRKRQPKPREVNRTRSSCASPLAR